MGRTPIGRQAMTDAQRQRRRRRKLRKARSAEWHRLERLKGREKNSIGYIPAPPGITYWRERTVRAKEDTTLMLPTTRPLAACETTLDDDEVVALFLQICKLAHFRGITLTVPDLSKYNPLSDGMMHCEPESAGCH